MCANMYMICAPKRRTFPIQETVLLLTTAAVYFCRFDFTMDKVSAFERIGLENIQKLQYGVILHLLFLKPLLTTYSVQVHTLLPLSQIPQRIRSKTLGS